MSNKKIILGPEGSKKSRGIIESIINSNDTNITIFSSHTIKNSIEKFEYAKSLPKKNCSVVRICSNSEFFRNMISKKSKDISDLFNNSKLCSDKYIRFQLTSHSKNTNEFKPINRNVGNVSKLKSSLGNTPDDYNNTVTNMIYNDFNSVNGKLDYYLAINLSDDAPKIDDELIPNFSNILSEYECDLHAINDLYRSENIEVICIPGEYIKKYKFNLKQRDIDLKDALTEKGKSIVIFSQNKTVEDIIIPILDRLELSNTHIIIDEILDSDFVYNTNTHLCNTMNRITKKIHKNGFASLNRNDVNFLKDNNLYTEVKNKTTNDYSITMNNMSLIVSNGNCESFIGKPSFCKRLQFFNNITILTSERFKSEILKEALDFTIENTDETYIDDKLFIYETSKNTDIKIVKSESDNIIEYVNTIKNSYDKHSDVLVIGTSYFNPDYTTSSCRGINPSSDLKKLVIITNMAQQSVSTKYVAYVNEFFKNIPSNTFDYVSKNLRIDELNQIIGRVCGPRREYLKDTIVELYYYNKDRYLKDALQEIRYKGTIITNPNDINCKIELSKSNYKKTLETYNKVDSFLRLYSDKDYINKNTTNPISMFTLKNTYGQVTYTKLGMINVYIPSIFSKISVDYPKSKSSQFFIKDYLFDNFVEDREKYLYNDILIKDKLSEKTLKYTETSKNNYNEIIDKCHKISLLIDYDWLDDTSSLDSGKNVKTDLFLISNFYYKSFELQVNEKITNDKNTEKHPNTYYSYELNNLINNEAILYSYMHTIDGMNYLGKLQCYHNSLENKSFYKTSLELDLTKYNSQIKDRESFHNNIYTVKLICLIEYLWKNELHTLRQLVWNKLNKSQRIILDDNKYRVEVYKYIAPHLLNIFKSIYNENDIKKHIPTASSHKITPENIKIKFKISNKFIIRSIPNEKLEKQKDITFITYNPIKLYNDILTGKLKDLKSVIINNINSRNLTHDEFIDSHKVFSKNFKYLSETCGINPNDYFVIKSKKKSNKTILNILSFGSNVPIFKNKTISHVPNPKNIFKPTSTYSNLFFNQEKQVLNKGNKLLENQFFK
jgi:hypothetical protein